MSEVAPPGSPEAAGRPARPPPGTAPAPAGAGVGVGRLVGLTFSTWRRCAPAVLATGAIYLLADAALAWALGHPTWLATPAQEVERDALLAEWTGTPASWIFSLASLQLATLQGAVLSAVVDLHLGGRPAGLRDWLAALGRRPLALVLLSALASVLSWAATVWPPSLAPLAIALILPALWLGLTCSLAVPAVISEGRGAVDALRRSAELTRGHRWAVLGCLLATMLPGVVVEEAGKVLAAGTAWALVTDALSRVPFGSLFFMAPAVAFHLLRAGREGARTGGLAEVFE